MFDLFSPKPKKNPKIRPLVLLVIDGFGVAPPSPGNAISQAKTPTFDWLKAQYPYGRLIAAGESVGLPANEAGNSEVGHLTIGAGRVVYQSLPRINMAIKDDSFFETQAFLKAATHVAQNHSKLHIVGLVSSGTVHSSTDHMFALLDFCHRQRVSNVCLHLFTDGRDAPPNDALQVIKNIHDRVGEGGDVRVATITGRYYAMDRDGRWERTKVTYEAMVEGKGKQVKSAVEAIENAYKSGRSDEFIEPTVVLSKDGHPSLIEDNDAVIFFNFRIDRPRQLTMAFTIPDFEQLKEVEFGYIPHEGMRHGNTQAEGPTFKRAKVLKNLFFVTMTQYQAQLPVSAIAFPPPQVSNSLVEILSQNELGHLHMAESEKERMVTFYMNGLREVPFPREERIIISSPRVPTYDKKPEMSLFSLVSRFKKELFKDQFHFIVLNFANPDMVAHSGNLAATIKAIEAVDKATGELVNAVLSVQGAVVITADHGNAEQLVTLPTSSYFFTSESGEINTEHSNNPVPIHIISSQLQGKSTEGLHGSLSDVAPTILSLMKIPVPQEMTGKNLLQ